MAQFRFRLTGVPPDQALKMVEVNTEHKISDIKKTGKWWIWDGLLGRRYISEIP